MSDRSMNRSLRQAMIDRGHKQLSLVRQCTLLNISRASVYYRPVSTRAEDLELMARMDRQYLKTPFYGSRRMKAWLLAEGYLVSRSKVRRLMRLMGLEAIYRRPNTSKPAPGHRVYPYLLKGVDVNRVDQVTPAGSTRPSVFTPKTWLFNKGFTARSTRQRCGPVHDWGIPIMPRDDIPKQCVGSVTSSQKGNEYWDRTTQTHYAAKAA